MSGLYSGVLRSLGTRKGDEKLPEDDGLSELALMYARQIDEDHAKLALYGPMLQSALAELGLTPRSRAAIMRNATELPRTARQSPLDKARDEVAAQREKHGTAG